MQYLHQYYNKTLKYDLINKFCYTKLTQLPKLKKIILTFNCGTDNVKTISQSLLALELLIFQKGILNTSKKTNMLLKIRKGSPIGCKVTLRKKQILQFFIKSSTEIFPKIKNFDGLIVTKKSIHMKHSFSYLLENIFNLSNLEQYYYLFNNLSTLNITLVAKNYKFEELLFIFKTLQIPLISK